MILVRKRFGQHFLEPVWVDKVVKAIAPKPDQAFIEIGPGPGALTRQLAARAKSVTAYEIDRDLAAALVEEAIPNLTVVEGDFLKLEISDLRLQTSDLLRVAGNLPYNVASPIMFRLIELHAAGVPLVDATLMLQREVADRLVAPPGSKEYGVLSILIGHAADVDTVLKLPAGDYCYAVEAARGRFAVRIVSDNKEIPYRVKLRTPSFSNLSLYQEASKGMILPDALALLGSLDLVIPDIDR